MTTLNTIIEEEKKGAKESVLETFEDGTIRYCPRDLETKITTAMQRAYEAGKADNAQENTPDTEKCEHKVVKKYCFRCKRPDLAGNVKNTPDTEWEKELEQHAPNLTFKSLDNGVNTISMVWLKSFIRTTLTSRDTYWKGRNQVFVNNIIEDIENMKGVYSANDAIAKVLDIIKSR